MHFYIAPVQTDELMLYIPVFFHKAALRTHEYKKETTSLKYVNIPSGQFRRSTLIRRRKLTSKFQRFLFDAEKIFEKALKSRLCLLCQSSAQSESSNRISTTLCHSICHYIVKYIDVREHCQQGLIVRKHCQQGLISLKFSKRLT